MANINSPSLYCELLSLAGPEGKMTFTKSNIRIGRQPDNDFVTLDAGTSRIHAEIIWDKNVWKIRNLNPANKITVNQQDIQQEAELHHFDEIGLGRSARTTLRFLTHPHKGDEPDPTVDSTDYMEQSSVDAALGKQKNDEVRDPQPNSQETAWQLVGIILATVSAIITSYALGPTMFIPGIITLIIGILLCIGIIMFSRKQQPLSPLSWFNSNREKSKQRGNTFQTRH